MPEVKSSNIAAIDYDWERQILRVSFRSGGIYEYDDVGDQVYQAFLGAPSKGRFFHDFIRDQYGTRRIG